LAALACSPGPEHAASPENGHAAVPGPSAQSAPAWDDDGFPAAPEPVTAPLEIREVIRGLDRHLRRSGSVVRSCDRIVRIQIGKNSVEYGRGLAAFGAFCTLADGRRVAMCYDNAIGNFVMAGDDFVDERAWLEEFTLRTCVEEPV
jgi:hypothetical protein